MEYHEKNPTIKRWQDEVRAERNNPKAKALNKPKPYDSLAHLLDPKTGKYDLKLHSKKRALEAKKK